MFAFYGFDFLSYLLIINLFFHILQFLIYIIFSQKNFFNYFYYNNFIFLQMIDNSQQPVSQSQELRKTKCLIKNLPKCQLHIHIEGTLQPEMIFEIAKRNGIKTKQNSVEELRQKYQFNCLQDFLDIYYAGCSVLQKQEDFYDLTISYFKKCQENNIVHAQIFVDPQTHAKNNVPFKTIINGIDRARKFAQENWQISSYIIVCFLRDLDEEFALKTFDEVLNFRQSIKGFGLDSSQLNNPPQKFVNVFKRARDEGFEVVAHAGEEAPCQYIWDTLQLLKVKRIDHGVRCIEDEKLMEKLAKQKIPLTMCPASNFFLKIYLKFEDIPIRKFMSKGMIITINSDDPAYFQGYVNYNFQKIAQHLKLTHQQIKELVKNSFTASFLPENVKVNWINKLSEINN